MPEATQQHYEFIFRLSTEQVGRIVRLSRQQRRGVERALGALVLRSVIGKSGHVLHDAGGIVEEALSEPTN